jgi:hypothetical protein
MDSRIKQEHIVRQISAPTLVIDDIVFDDMETGTEAVQGMNAPGGPRRYSKTQGFNHPLIQINEFIFKENDVSYFKIDTSGFVPTVTCTILVKSKMMYSTSFPKDGDIFSVFIRSKDDTYKPIRNDYEITSVRVDGEKKEMTPEWMTISGVLNVPGLTDMRCFSKSGTSYDVLQQVANELGLGFASNEISTKDHQNWLCTYKTTQEFIKEVAAAAWKDEKSFFACFIDVFYNLNFVNIDPLFSLEPGKEIGISIESYTTDFDVDTELIKNNLSILFTNNLAAQYSSQWINKYQQINKANTVNREFGYVKYNHYYDSLLRKPVKMFVDPLTSPGAEEKKYILKGRNNTDQRFQRVTHEWMGTLYGMNGENQHSKYFQAITWNTQNLAHLDKLYLEVELDNVNMTVRKYQVIPLLITVTDDTIRKIVNTPTGQEGSAESLKTKTTEGTAVSQPEQLRNDAYKSVSSEELPFVVDKFYTGNYVIQEIYYTYDKFGFRQVLKLLRREWPAPPQINRINNTI